MSTGQSVSDENDKNISKQGHRGHSQSVSSNQSHRDRNNVIIYFPSGEKPHHNRSVSETMKGITQKIFSRRSLDNNNLGIKPQLDESQLTVYKKGWLYKQSFKRKSWNRKWFVLTDDWMRYYESDNEKKNLATLHMDCKIVYPTPGYAIETMSLIFVEKTLLLRSDNEGGLVPWVTALRNSVLRAEITSFGRTYQREEAEKSEIMGKLEKNEKNEKVEKVEKIEKVEKTNSGKTTSAAGKSTESTNKAKNDEKAEIRELREKAIASVASTQSNLQNQLIEILKTVSAHKYAPPFRKPVTKSEAPDYYDIIEEGMDFGTIKKLLKSNDISTVAQFCDKLFLIYRNAMVYNMEGSDYYIMAEALRDYSLEVLQKEFPDEDLEKWAKQTGRKAGKRRREETPATPCTPNQPNKKKSKKKDE
eukprot:c19188_g1_i1.p1 GENE.c19188_g1_i1~~c19188_g1_i1.p1  ORF type:complete len:418 (+),score=152.50 c19188_g1_i1:33-1286(+)